MVDNIHKVSITEASLKGVSFVARTANEEGVVMLTKNDFPYALVLPMTKPGIRNFIANIEKTLKLHDDSEYIKNLQTMYNILVTSLDN